MRPAGSAESAPLTVSAGAGGRLGVLAIVLLALGWGMLEQAPGANQNAHLALVTALSEGTPRIDRLHEWTADSSYVDQHYYAAKAPGLALVTEPWYRTLDLLGLVVTGPVAGVKWPRAQLEMPRSSVWQVGLFGATLPALVLLLLVRSTANRFVPGYGTVAAVCLGAGSLVGVFATMFFAHALSACLGFATFAILARERGRPSDLRLLALAGLAAGLAVVVEFPLAIVAVACAAYAGARPGHMRRIAVYALGVVVGVAPLLAFNAWAFGSPFTLSYSNAVLDPGATGHDVVGANASGFFGVGVPSLRVGVELLLSGTGLLVIAPLWAFACAGLVLLWRDGQRAEASLVGSLAAAFLLYNASYWLPFGGGTPGPRFLVPVLAFLALPLAAAWRAWPIPAVALAAVSIVITSASLVADPLSNVEDAGIWFDRLARGNQVSETVLHWVWGGSATGQVGVILVLVAAACVTAVAVTPRPRISAEGVALALALLIGWRILSTAAPIMLEVDRRAEGWAGLGAAMGALLAIVLAVLLFRSGLRVAALAAVLLTPLLSPAYAAHTGLALATVVVALAALATLGLLRRQQASVRA